jgi:hypothetical protein
MRTFNEPIHRVTESSSKSYARQYAPEVIELLSNYRGSAGECVHPCVPAAFDSSFDTVAQANPLIGYVEEIVSDDHVAISAI